jgi:hypothetical protein
MTDSCQVLQACIARIACIISPQIGQDLRMIMVTAVSIVTYQQDGG